MRTANQRTGTPKALRTLAAAAILAALAASTPARGADEPSAGDNLTFRPTVIVRNGPGQGSGTIIASVDRETLILTAAHVVEGPGPLRIELHRYNLGVERSAQGGRWPIAVPAEVVAADPDADVAIVRVKTLAALPFVAQLLPGPENALPAVGTAVTSVGIDLGSRLSGWTTRVTSVDRFEIEGRGAEHIWLITSRAPLHGRSGGGLFLDSGELVGVCVGRAQLKKGRTSGVFAAALSVRRLLRDHDLDTRVASLSTAVVPSTRPAPPRPPINATRAAPRP